MKKIDVKDHIGLAHLACKSYRSLVGRGFDYEDLVQAACEGLIYAADTYDETRGQFSTYAVPMARKFVKRFVATSSRTVKCPEYAQDRAAAAGRQKKPASDAPRARRTSGGPFDWGAPTSPGTPTVRVAYQGPPSTWASSPSAVHAPSAERSFDFAFGEGGESTLHDVLSDAEAPTPEDLVATLQTRKWRGRGPIWEAINALGFREQTVILGRLYGHTQPQIAAVFGVTKARIQQIEAAAVAQLTAVLAGPGQSPLGQIATDPD